MLRSRNNLRDSQISLEDAVASLPVDENTTVEEITETNEFPDGETHTVEKTITSDDPVDEEVNFEDLNDIDPEDTNSDDIGTTDSDDDDDSSDTDDEELPEPEELTDDEEVDSDLDGEELPEPESDDEGNDDESSSERCKW